MDETEKLDASTIAAEWGLATDAVHVSISPECGGWVARVAIILADGGRYRFSTTGYTRDRARETMLDSSKYRAETMQEIASIRADILAAERSAG